MRSCNLRTKYMFNLQEEDKWSNTRGRLRVFLGGQQFLFCVDFELISSCRFHHMLFNDSTDSTYIIHDRSLSQIASLSIGKQLWFSSHCKQKPEVLVTIASIERPFSRTHYSK